ncbi:hypothetical protein HKX48_000208 [Thoreauomyces humboldtii]|nr:hypothetical protein HKX48_000208 [Thoreauomyces humboldtii]
MTALLNSSVNTLLHPHRPSAASTSSSPSEQQVHPYEFDDASSSTQSPRDSSAYATSQFTAHSERLARKSRSDSSLKDGILATLHTAKEALKDACHHSTSSTSAAAVDSGKHEHRREGSQSDPALREPNPEISVSDESGSRDHQQHNLMNTSAATMPIMTPKGVRESLGPSDVPPRLTLAVGARKGGRIISSATTRDVKKFVKAFPELATEGDHLEATYSCALERDGMWHGRMFLTNAHLSFAGKHFTKSVKIILKFEEITGVEKKSTAGVFPNALRMTVDPDRRYVFSSFLKRDAAYNDLVNLWKAVVSPMGSDNGSIIDLERAKALEMQEEVRAKLLEPVKSFVDGEAPLIDAPALRSSSSEPEISHLAQLSTASGTVIPSGTGGRETRDRASTLASSGIDFFKKMLPKASVSSFGSGMETAPVPGAQANAERTVGPSSAITERSPVVGSFLTSATTPKSSGSKLLRRLSTGRRSATRANTNESVTMPRIGRLAEDHPGEFQGTADASAPTLPGVSAAPTTSPVKPRPVNPVSCDCATHPEYEALDTVVDLDVETVFRTVFADADSETVREAHRRRDTHGVVFGPWVVDTKGLPLSREVTYTVSYKPPMMSKQTAPAFEKQTVLKQDLLAVYVVECSVRTPKAPYGEFFNPINRYCLTHAGPGKTRILVTVKVEYTKRLMWKNQIESATVDGVKAFCGDLVALLKSGGTVGRSAGSLPRPQPTAGGAATLVASPASTDTPATTNGHGKHHTRTHPPGSLASRLFGCVAHVTDTLFKPLLAHPTGPDPTEKTRRRRRERRARIIAFLVLGTMVIMGLAITALNVYWVIDVGRRLDKTISGLERVKEMVANGELGKGVLPAAVVDPQEVAATRAHLLHRAQTKLTRARTILRSAQHGAAGLEVDTGEVERRTSDVLLRLSGFLKDADGVHSKQKTEPPPDLQASGAAFASQDPLDALVDAVGKLRDAAAQSADPRERLP